VFLCDAKAPEPFAVLGNKPKPRLYLGKPRTYQTEDIGKSRKENKRGGRASRDKGNRFERAIVACFKITALAPNASRFPDLQAVPIQAI
jgi:hypothetical protein